LGLDYKSHSALHPEMLALRDAGHRVVVVSDANLLPLLSKKQILQERAQRSLRIYARSVTGLKGIRSKETSMVGADGLMLSACRSLNREWSMARESWMPI
jgi:hypothetical protein